MTTQKPLVTVTRRLPDVIETRMMELFETQLNLEDRPMSQSELIQAVKEADVLVPTVTDRIDAGVLSQAGPNLKLIASFGTGVETRFSAPPVVLGPTVIDDGPFSTSTVFIRRWVGK